jgi:hypothetical protein
MMTRMTRIKGKKGESIERYLNLMCKRITKSFFDVSSYVSTVPIPHIAGQVVVNSRVADVPFTT